jgi:hypothetical protein
MRDDDFWNRDYRHHPMSGRNFWDDHAAATELLMKGNQILAAQIVDSLGLLWRRLRRSLVTAQHRTDGDRRYL